MSGAAVEEMLVVGKITGCYGLKGWVKIHSYTEPLENFQSFGGWQTMRQGVFKAVKFDAFKRHGKGLVAHIAEVDDRTRAESYRGLEVSIPASHLPELPRGEYYWRDLQGLQVWCQNGGDRVLVGIVDHLIETGANDVLVVKSCEHSVDMRERLIPYLPGNTVVRVDIEEAVIEVDWFLDED
ncbi:MAG: ribosome maturation factor RimM [Halioglobus sp.]|nr:ribosome maturation factor RimM [Halioglobus sp.]